MSKVKLPKYTPANIRISRFSDAIMGALSKEWLMNPIFSQYFPTIDPNAQTRQ